LVQFVFKQNPAFVDIVVCICANNMVFRYFYLVFNADPNSFS